MEISDAIKIAKILAMAPEERLPLILSVLEKADVTLEGLEELEEWKAIKEQSLLIDLEELRSELLKAFPGGGDIVKIPAGDFNEFCKRKKLRPTLTRRALARKGFIRTNGGEDGKLNYTENAWINGRAVRCVILYRPEKTGGNEDGQ
jgi:antitoxin component of RelBE/YafQ-DinJ toxin-antitoxin module